MFPEHGMHVAAVMQNIVAHELAHYRCMAMPDGSLWCRVHNAAQWLIVRLADLLPDGLPVWGPGALGTWVIDRARAVRERAADRIADRFMDAHPEKFASVITVTEA